MKKLILLGALSVLFYSAIGNAGNMVALKKAEKAATTEALRKASEAYQVQGQILKSMQQSLNEISKNIKNV